MANHPVEALAQWRAPECEPYRLAAHDANKAYAAAKGREARKIANEARALAMKAFGDALGRAHARV